MAPRPLTILTAIMVLAAVVLLGLYWAQLVKEPEPDPFHMTLVVSSDATNASDPNLTDLVLWVAVAGGTPHPRWTAVSLMAGPEGSLATVEPPRLLVDDQDGDGRISEGDLLWVFGLDTGLVEGGFSLVQGERVIAKV
jgi:hypothetical protein